MRPASALLLALLCLGASLPAQSAKSAAKAAPKSVDRFAIRPDEKVSWHDVRATDLEGRAFTDAERKSFFDRLPADVETVKAYVRAFAGV